MYIYGDFIVNRLPKKINPLEQKNTKKWHIMEEIIVSSYISEKYILAKSHVTQTALTPQIILLFSSLNDCKSGQGLQSF